MKYIYSLTNKLEKLFAKVMTSSQIINSEKNECCTMVE